MVLDGAGGQFDCVVEAAAGSEVKLSVRERLMAPPLPCRVTLLQAIPKGKLMEAIIQKATELGVARVVPLLAERVATRLEGESAAQKGTKWQQTAIEAMKQCGAPWLPRIETPLTPAAFLERRENIELSLLGSLQPDSRHPRTGFDDFRQRHGRLPVSASFWIGPEGDFTPQESAAIESSGALPITLGPLVLRTETAALYCLSILTYELGAPR